MRTTLTLDPDVVQLVQDEVHRRQTTTKQIINDALRRALRPAAADQAPFRQRTHHSRLQPGIDAQRMNSLADEIDDAAIISAGPLT